MKNMIKQKKNAITSSTLIVMIVVTAIIISKLMGLSFADNTFVVSNGKYIITDDKKKEVQYTGMSKKSKTSVSIPKTIKINGQEYKVDSIKANAIKGNKKVKKLTIGENVKTIDKNAFYGCKNLKTIVIKTSNLTSTSVKADAFKGLNAKAVVTVPEKKLTSYKKILKSKGLTGKNQKVKGKKMETEAEEKEEEKKEEEVPEITFGPDHPLPNPDYAIASIGDISKAGSLNFDKVKVTDTSEYSAGDSIPFSAVIRMHPDIYGRLGTREAYGIWWECNRCGKKFSGDEEMAIHICMSPDGCLGSCRYPEKPQNYAESYWIPDNAPCKTVFHFTLSAGLSYKEDSIRLMHSQDGEIDSSAYKKEISGNELTVTIDDIKAEPFYNRDISYFRERINVLFDTEMNENTVAANTASASVTYYYKGEEKTIDLGRFTLYAASLQVKNTDSYGIPVNGAKFALYKEKVVYNGSNIGTPKFYKIAEGTSESGILDFAGIGEGRYKLKQASVPEGYKKASDIIFNISMDKQDGRITSITIKDDFGKNFPWEVDTGTGVISAMITNQ